MIHKYTHLAQVGEDSFSNLSQSEATDRQDIAIFEKPKLGFHYFRLEEMLDYR